MKTRVIFGLSGFIFVLLALYALPAVVFNTVMVALSVVATYEFLKPTKLVKNRILLLFSLIASLCTSIVYSYSLSDIYIKVIVVAMAIAGLCVVLSNHEKVSVNQVANAMFGGVLVPYMLLGVVRIFHMENGNFILLLPLLAGWGSDTCAYFAGVNLGKHKLAPIISPKKTVEGSIGGIIGGAIFVLIATMILNKTIDFGLSYMFAMALGAVGAIIGQIGDLAFSIIKRQTGIKDYGNVFPGHGGVLDRFDSIIFVAPVFEIALLFAFS